MYLSGFPRYFVKDDERRAVYYTVDARDLLATGWTEEVKESKVKKIKQSEPEAIQEVKTEKVADEDEKSIDFEAMTRAELLKYALDRNVDLPNNAPKHQLVESCKALK